MVKLKVTHWNEGGPLDYRLVEAKTENLAAEGARKAMQDLVRQAGSLYDGDRFTVEAVS